MANTACWYQTQLPKKLIDALIDDIQDNIKADEYLEDSVLTGKRVEKDIRDSKNSWIHCNSWIGGVIWYYVALANRENFLYDITEFIGDLQYTQYDKGNYYNWHTDQDIRSFRQADEMVRKLSFSLQLTDEDDYTGGDIEFRDVDDKRFFAPKNRGCIIVFDSRTEHRVSKVESGVRKSLVGWVVGPRWK